MTHEKPEEKLSHRIMALFTQARPRLTKLDIDALLPNDDPDNIKDTLLRLRGKGGIRRLRIVSYVKYRGRPGLEVAMLEVGDLPDVVKTADSIEDNDELLRRARWIRDKREEHRLKKQLEALDAW